MKSFALSFSLLASLLVAASAVAAEKIFADFEHIGFATWAATGDAFGDSPATAPLPGQHPVSGFQGQRFINSFHGGDASTGTLVSPPFQIEHAFISFLIGGGAHEGETCIELIIDDRVVRTATGRRPE